MLDQYVAILKRPGGLWSAHCVVCVYTSKPMPKSQATARMGEHCTAHKHRAARRRTSLANGRT